MTRKTVWIVAVVTLLAGAVVGAAVAMSVTDGDTPDPPTAGNDTDDVLDRPELTMQLSDDATVEQFGTAEAFKEYVTAGQRQRGGARGFGGPLVREQAVQMTAEAGSDDMAGGDDMDGGDSAAPEPAATPASDSPDRVAESNVQVAGLDEPDLVKTDGSNFYYSPFTDRYHPRLAGADDVDWERHGLPEPATHVVDITDPAEPAAIADVNGSGKLFRTGDVLVVFDRIEGQIVGYDVSDPANPVERWRKPLDDRLVTAREADGQLYVVTRTGVGPGTTCPIEPLGEGNAVDCGEIYSPEVQTDADATYTAFSIDAGSGEVEDSVSFVGTGANTVVYMSQDSLYLTYTTGLSRADLLVSWVTDSDRFPADVKERVREIDSYDISDASKEREIHTAIERWLDSLSEEERQELDDQLHEEFQSHMADHQEQLTQTGIVHVEVDGDDLTVGETGTVPGEPLNQFALDEYEGTLRVATTIPRAGDAESVNNLYVLDSETLDREDEVTGMGEDQRIFAVRYVGDTAYLITFRQVDPFYVVDFEEPTDPELLGELKLPGFSTYLHPVDNETVLGIGEEGRQVKAVLFDVTDPTDPEVGDDLLVDAGWSAIDESHHAFLMDRRHEVFFLPAENRGLVVDYSGGQLDVVMDIEAENRVSRARYVDDYLYVFAGDEIIVVDQTEWERVKTLQLGEESRDG